MRRLSRIAAMSAALSGAIYSDTIRTRDPDSPIVNGSLIQMNGDELSIVARYDSGSKTLTIKLAAVDVIEFNGTTFNSGAPRKALGIGPPLKTKASPKEPVDTIVLRGAQRRTCKLIGIDEQTVHCSGKEGDYSRRVVLRILLREKE